eukprot:TRINITY_DN17354_c0_g1_i1.p1 TRINITY_DN17354_c0_g1~~TRINITY_DN17354_c0_g1_i1.p1  ORF type:complete len:223 (-),score=22.64 TRINITY_DN17354_c0_g1_i1:625-1293(-)
MKGVRGRPLPLSSLNHISRNCRDIRASVAFYEDVLGFIQIVRPSRFDFDGAWLFQYGIGLHLLKEETEKGVALLEGNRCKAIDPRADHISFQADNTGVVEQRLREFGVEYKKQAVIEGNIRVQQIFFHDPDGHMIEICDCEALPIIPLSGDCLTCPARFKQRRLAPAEEEKIQFENAQNESMAAAFEEDRKWGVRASGQVGLPKTASCGDIAGNESLFPVCA